MLKQYPLIVVVALFVLLGGLVFAYWKCNHDPSKSGNNDSLSDMLKAYKDSTHYYKNKYGETVAEKRTVEGSLANIKSILGSDSLEILAKRFDTKMKYMLSYVQTIARTQTHLRPDSNQQIVYLPRDTSLAGNDTCKTFSFITRSFSSPYYKADVRLGDSAYLFLNAWDTLNIVQKRDFDRGFLSKRWYTSTQVIGANKDTKYAITGAYKFYDQKPTRWAVVLYAGAGYNMAGLWNNLKWDYLKNNVQGQVGIGVSRILFRLK